MRVFLKLVRAVYFQGLLKDYEESERAPKRTPAQAPQQAQQSAQQQIQRATAPTRIKR
tara:strand:- start:2053 stop:2226 length:174 start_codon:yes stop_codon:yes gene_type:complete